MASLSDLPLRHRLFLSAYRFRALDPVPFAPLGRPLPETRVALVTTGALHLPDQEPFDEGARGGDVSFRVIPTGIDPRLLRIAHRSDAFDRSGIEEDRNVAFPLDRLAELEAAGEVRLAPRHLSFMGSITAPGRLVAGTARDAADLLRSDGAGAALLVPV